MKKLENLTKAMEIAKDQMQDAAKEKVIAEMTAATNNTRANKKRARRAGRKVDKLVSRVAHLTAELATAEEKIKGVKSFPHKKDTVAQPKSRRKPMKMRHTPPAQKAVSENISMADAQERYERSIAWEAEKKAEKPKPVFTPAKKANEGMADASTNELLATAWAEYDAGNINALAAVKDLVDEGNDKKKDTVTPADVDPGMFKTERAKIARLEKELAELPFKWKCIQERLKEYKSKVNGTKSERTKARRRATRTRNMYISAKKDRTKKDKMPELYDKMMKARKAVIKYDHILPSYERKLERAIARELEYIDFWPAEEERLKAELAKEHDKLEIAKLARRHENRQKDLEEAFSQRYERAEWIPEKEAPGRYKAYSVKPMYLFYEYIDTLKKLQQLAAEQEAGWIQEGRELVLELVRKLKTANGPYQVDAKDCVVNNVNESMMSIIMGIEPGKKTPCKEMLLCNYDIAGTFKIYWKFLADEYAKAQACLHVIRALALNRLTTYGLELDDDGNTLSYAMLASNNSQQKKGQMYMGEVKTMKRSEELRELGFTFDDAIENRPDNAAEYLKRGSTLTTPSKLLRKQDGEPISIMRILMVDDVEIERWFDNVKTIDGKKLSKAERKLMKLTMFDGQGVALKEGIPSTQTRGAALKLMLAAKPKYQLPEFAKDIMGNIVRVADYDVLMTKSCWKAAKMGMNWYQFREAVTKLAERCPGYDLLRAVRYSDREIGDEENPRYLARQATQQLVKAPKEDLDKLTRATRRWLKEHKNFWNILHELAEWDKPYDERSDLGKLFTKMPQLVMNPYIKQWIAQNWTRRRDNACSGHLLTKGVYPYIVQDPIAQIQICLEGRSPYDTNLGVVKEGFVNLPKVSDGKKMFAIRYPANYIVAMVLVQQNCPEFAELGNVAVLSYYGDTIVRADGDFDGDEMLFIFNQLLVKLLEETVGLCNPTLIDFPHGKVACDKPFGTTEKFTKEITEALVRAQEYNLVGLYSNLAVICLQQASLAKDGTTMGKWLHAARIAHVGAIVCLDMVKGANVPDELKELLADMNQKIRKVLKMPWNQQFSHTELTADDVEKRTTSTQDTIAGLIYDDAGEFEIEEAPFEWDDELLRKFVPAGVLTTNVRNLDLDDEAMRILRGCHFEDELDKATWEKLNNGDTISLKEWLQLGWRNSASLVWKMQGGELAEKRNEMYWFIREVVMANVRKEWKNEDGHVYTLEEKYASLVKNVAARAFGFWVKDGELTKRGNGIDADRRGSYAMFMLRVFAKDLLAILEKGIVTKELAEEMTAPREQEEEESFWMSFLSDFDGAEEVIWDGSFEMSDEEVDYDWCVPA